MIKILLVTLISIFTFQSALSQFGKNRVQYESFDWRYIESKHFDVYFHEGGDYLAKFTVVQAERSLAQIEKHLNYKLKRRISFIVFNSHNQFQQNNIINQFLSENVGGVTQLFKNRIVIPYQGDYTQFRHVIHHELVHGVLNDLFHGGTLQSSLSSNNLFFIPGWLNEGLCEYLSFMNDTEGLSDEVEFLNGMDTKTDMFMRDLIMSEKLPPLERIGGYAQYRVGQTFYWYVADKYGQEKVGDFINRLKILKNVKNAFLSSFDMTIEDFTEMWETDIKRYYWPELEKFKSLIEFADRVTNRKKMNNFYNSAPVISPNGKDMVFIKDESGILTIAIMEDFENKKNVRVLIESFRSQDFEDLNMLSPGISWRPTGTHLAISAKSGGEDGIYIVDVKTGEYDKILLGFKNIESVQWSNDGKKLVFIASDNEYSDLFIYDFTKKDVDRLTYDIFSDKMPKWAPDSENIYFLSDRRDVTSNDLKSKNIKMWDFNFISTDIYKMNIFTKEITRITNTPSYEKTSIAVSSDGNKILYASSKNGIGNLYELNLINMIERPLTNSLQEITQLSLSNDDSRLLFGSQIDGGYDIFSLKYPFEIKSEFTELPLTRFKENKLQQDSIIEEFKKSQIDQDESSELISYGDFELDFESQQIVKPNQDALIRNESSADLNYDTNFVIKDYKLKFSTDLALFNPGYSTFWGAQGSTFLMFSDELGDHQIMVNANILTDITNSFLTAEYSYLKGIIDYSVGVYHFAGLIESVGGNLDKFRNFGINLKAKYPLDLFNRFEFNFQIINLIQTQFNLSNVSVNRTRTLLVPELGYVHDDVFWGIYGPNRGSRYYFKIYSSPNIFSDGIDFHTLQTDVRTYLPTSTFSGFAFRFTGAASFGNDPLKFHLGGADNWINRRFTDNRFPFENPEDFAFLNFVTPLRGFAMAEISGTKFLATNAEFRFPLAQAFGFGVLPVLLQGLMGTVFLDAGLAWEDKLRLTQVNLENRKEYFNDLLMSTGLGFRSYVFGIPLKMDIAWTYNNVSWSQPWYVFTLGFDF